MKKATKFIFITIAIIFLSACAIVFAAPVVLTFTNSFMSQIELASNYGRIFESLTGSGVFVSGEVSLKLIPDIVDGSQYLRGLIQSPAYLTKFWNSVVLVAPITIFQLLVASLASYAFARAKSKFRSLIFFLYIVLMLMPYQVTLVPNFFVARAAGILNTRWAVILPGIFSPFAVFIITKYMRRIHSSVVEAAKIDGAGEISIYTKIYMPLSKSTLFACALLIFIDYWNMVEQPLILLPENPDAHPLSVFLSQINAGDVGVAFAVASVYMVIPVLMFLYGEEYLIEGIEYSGGIKG
jgi:multiple sugar transport system permease protein